MESNTLLAIRDLSSVREERLPPTNAGEKPKAADVFAHGCAADALAWRQNPASSGFLDTGPIILP